MSCTLFCREIITLHGVCVYVCMCVRRCALNRCYLASICQCTQLIPAHADHILINKCDFLALVLSQLYLEIGLIYIAP